jgi:uncharacterized protein (DUF736 family)
VRARNSELETTMTTIGSFKKFGTEFQGEIVTLSVQAKNVRIVPGQPGQRQRTFAPGLCRPRRDRSRLGAPLERGPRLSLSRTRRPSLTTPIYANLFNDEDGATYSLIWSRSRKPNGD